MISCFPGSRRPVAAENIAGPAGYFERALAVAAAACKRPEATVKRINLGGGKHGIVHFSDCTLEKLLFPAVGHQELPEPKAEADFKILAWDSVHSGIPMWSPPWTTGDYLARGEIAGYNDGRFRAVFQLGSGVFSFYDSHRRIGLWWARDFVQLPLYEKAAPFLLLFHWFHALGGDDSVLLHAAAVGTEDRGGVLLAGRGGSGKSTTALASLLVSRWRYVADDYCVVRAAETSPTVHSLYCSAKIGAKMLGGFANLCRGACSFGGRRDPEGKMVLNLHGSLPERLKRELPLRAILLPRIPKEKNGEASGRRFKPVGSGAAVRALAPSTLFQLPGAGHNNFRMITALANRLPCFQFELDSELSGVSQSLRHFLEQLPSQ